MDLSRLAVRSIKGNSFRSWVVVGCAMLVASLALATALVMGGAQKSLQLTIARLGADIIVVPQGAEKNVENAFLMSTPAKVWMRDSVLASVRDIPGVVQASPQLYLSSMSNASCCSVPDMFMIAYDPVTDFTVEPWIKQKVGENLRLGEAVGGSHVFTPADEEYIKLYGYFLTLRASLEPTGTGLDQTMFISFETAKDMARLSTTLAQEPLVIPPGQISAVLVRVASGVDTHQVAVDIFKRISGVTPVESANLFQSSRNQMLGLLRTNILILSITLALSLFLLGLIFSMAGNERRRELGVLRALGATRGFVFRSLIMEAGLLALVGGAAGVGLTTLVIVLFRTRIINGLGMPFLFPSILPLLGQIAGGLGLALLSVTLAALIPAYRISHQDPSNAMRE